MGIGGKIRSSVFYMLALGYLLSIQVNLPIKQLDLYLGIQ